MEEQAIRKALEANGFDDAVATRVIGFLQRHRTEASAWLTAPDGAVGFAAGLSAEAQVDQASAAVIASALRAVVAASRAT